MTTKPTPGPWLVNEEDALVYAEGENEDICICDLQSAGTACTNPAQALINARLIATAPELLLALKALLIETNQHAEGDCPRLLDACKNARVTIAKAEGK